MPRGTIRPHFTARRRSGMRLSTSTLTCGLIGMCLALAAPGPLVAQPAATQPEAAPPAASQPAGSPPAGGLGVLVIKRVTLDADATKRPPSARRAAELYNRNLRQLEEDFRKRADGVRTQLLQQLEGEAARVTERGDKDGAAAIRSFVGALRAKPSEAVPPGAQVTATAPTAPVQEP